MAQSAADADLHLIFPLADAHQYPELCGKKAYHLSILAAAGYHVPDGFVISTHAFRRRTTAAHNTDMAAILHAYEQLVAAGHRRVAVRTSATVEDMPAASFAGQFATFLEVEGPEALLQAVSQCWASIETARAVAYQSRQGLDSTSQEVAVIVQAMVRADVAGVLFTQDPVRNDPRRMLVTASYGAGEAVVSGRVSPDIFTVLWQRNGPLVIERHPGAKSMRLVPGPDGLVEEPIPDRDRRRLCLDDATVLELARIGRELAERFGAPQDIEWVLAAGRLYLLQSRPITTSAGAVRTKPPAGILGRLYADARTDYQDHFPLPLRPLDIDLVVRAALNAVLATMHWLGLCVPPIDQVICLQPDGTYQVELPTPCFGPRIALAPVRILSLLWHNARRDWETRDGPAVLRHLANAGSRSEHASAADLARRLDQLDQILSAFCTMRFRKYVIGNQIAQDMLKQMLGRVAGAASGELLRELTAVPQTATAAINAEIMALAHAASPDILARLRSLPVEQRWTQLQQWPEAAVFRQRFEDFLHRHGHRPTQGMVPVLSYPTWREQPETVLSLILALENSPFSDAGQSVGKPNLATRAATPQLRRNSLRPVVLFLAARARAAFWAREASLITIEQIVADMRTTALQLGHLLVEHAVIATVEDVFFLRKEELMTLARTLDARDSLRCQLEARKHAWSCTVNSVESYDKMESTVLRGHPASAGQVTGPARVIQGPESFEALRQGEILICPFTTPSWTPLFALAAAVVTETGGVLSHAAIVAREYGIPAVMSVPHIMRIVRNGQWITVDGTHGTVELLGANQHPA